MTTGFRKRRFRRPWKHSEIRTPVSIWGCLSTTTSTYVAQIIFYGNSHAATRQDIMNCNPADEESQPFGQWPFGDWGWAPHKYLAIWLRIGGGHLVVWGTAGGVLGQMWWMVIWIFHHKMKRFQQDIGIRHWHNMFITTTLVLARGSGAADQFPTFF